MPPSSIQKTTERHQRGKLREIFYFAGQPAARIECKPSAVPAPGQYVLALSAEPAASIPLENDFQVLAVPLFPAEISAEGFTAATPLPQSWGPGADLSLNGPYGTPFRPPAGVRRIALAGLGESIARLMPLVSTALQEECAVTLYTDAPLPSLPAAVEVFPLEGLPEAAAWADFLALDLPLEALPGLRRKLGLEPEQALPCPAQALIIAPMPCAGLAKCGACAVEGRRGWLLACEDGPVFDVKALRW